MSSLKKVTIVAAGSRGDIQPYIAIGIALERAGYDVRVLTNANHIPFVRSFELEGVPLYADSEKKMRENPKIRDAMANGDAGKFSKCLEAFGRENAASDARNFLNEIKTHVPDLIVAGTLSFYFGYYSSMILNIPVIKVSLQAMTYDPERAPLGIPTLPEGKHWDILLNIIASFHDGFQHIDKEMELLGGEKLVPIYPKTKFIREFEEPTLPTLVCQSTLFKEILHPRAPSEMRFVGASIIESDQQEMHNENFGGDETQKRIEDFLAADQERKPVYCGWGSMTCKSPEHMVVLAVRALQLSDQRGIILGGWAGLSMEVLHRAADNEGLIEYAQENILFVKTAAHESMFPRVACTVHHGGAGTTNAAFRSGVPTIITPVFADQYDHAHLVNKLGVGIGFSTQLQQISAEELSSAIKRAVQDLSIDIRARELSAKLRKEDGAAAVVSELEMFWEDYVQTGKWNAVIAGRSKDDYLTKNENLPRDGSALIVEQ